MAIKVCIFAHNSQGELTYNKDIFKSAFLKNSWKGILMLVVMMNDQLLAPTAVCQTCLMADQMGQPRFHHGRLTCGRSLEKLQEGQPQQYECQMGFKIADIG